MIAVMIEMTDDHVPAVAMELAELAFGLKKRTGQAVVALVYGREARDGARMFAAESGVETLGLVLEGKDHDAAGVARTLATVLRRQNPRHLLLAHTPAAMDLAPALAVAFELPLIAGVVGYDGENGTFYRSAGGGKTRLHVAAPSGAVVTTQPGALPAAPRAATPGPVAVEWIAESEGPARILSSHREETGASPLPGARVVVSVGRGIESKENLPLVAQFTHAIPGAAQGCSRPLVDMGWMPYPCQVGITGTLVSADLYIALGISGSTQHLAGIPRSATVVSINRDPNAAIHAICDLIIETALVPFMEATLLLLSDTSDQKIT